MEIFLVDAPRFFVFQRWPAKARDGEIRAAQRAYPIGAARLNAFSALFDMLGRPPLKSASRVEQTCEAVEGGARPSFRLRASDHRSPWSNCAGSWSASGTRSCIRTEHDVYQLDVIGCATGFDAMPDALSRIDVPGGREGIDTIVG